jgi:hypothetical protein
MTGSIHFNQFTPPVRHDTMTNDIQNLMADPATTPDAEALAGELIAKMKLGPHGRPYGGTPEEWVDSDAVPEQAVTLRPVKFRIVEANARTLAQEVGAIDLEHPEAQAVIAEFYDDDTAAEATLGRYVVLEVSDGVSLVFLVWFSAADRDAPLPEGFEIFEGASHSPAIAALGERQALLVQVFADEEFSDEASVQP